MEIAGVEPVCDEIAGSAGANHHRICRTLRHRHLRSFCATHAAPSAHMQTARVNSQGDIALARIHVTLTRVQRSFFLRRPNYRVRKLPTTIKDVR